MMRARSTSDWSHSNNISCTFYLESNAYKHLWTDKIPTSIRAVTNRGRRQPILFRGDVQARTKKIIWRDGAKLFMFFLCLLD